MDINAQLVLEALAKNEELLSLLYKKYSLRFGSYERLWGTLSLQEINHAGYIRNLYPKIKDGSVIFNPDRFNIKAIKSFSSYLDKLIKQGQGALINAFSNAMDIEKALIEKEFFKVFDSDSLELRALLRLLADETKEHRRLLEEEFDSFKATLP